MPGLGKPFYISNGDVDAMRHWLYLDDIREVYRRNRIGFNAKRIPRKQKKRLLREFTAMPRSRPVLLTRA